MFLLPEEWCVTYTFSINLHPILGTSYLLLYIIILVWMCVCVCVCECWINILQRDFLLNHYFPRLNQVFCRKDKNGSRESECNHQYTLTELCVNQRRNLKKSSNLWVQSWLHWISNLCNLVTLYLEIGLGVYLLHHRWVNPQYETWLEKKSTSLSAGWERVFICMYANICINAILNCHPS